MFDNSTGRSPGLALGAALALLVAVAAACGDSASPKVAGTDGSVAATPLDSGTTAASGGFPSFGGAGPPTLGGAGG